MNAIFCSEKTVFVENKKIVKIDESKIRSSIGIALDYLTPIGPLSFSLSEPITKGKNDITESFRFNLGTTF